ncbi:hypothetical protein [Streptomyces sp. cmx-4-9]|uniref:hypothetical protein n=1 Tax=Streptomyces sp. cmx-4-9 TaxID=2790941 RepID=UPI0039810D33
MTVTQASTPGTTAEAARAALEEVTDPGARAVALALLAVAESTQSVDKRLKQVNQYLGALANKP